MNSLLRGGTATIVLVLMSLVMLAACSSGGDDDATGATSPSTSAATAVPTAVPAPAAKPTVERLVISDAIPSVESNNPWKLENPRTPYYMRPMYESLIGVDALTGEFVPQLATEFSVEPDGTSLRFILRKGVRFHGDNGEFTAADVVATHANSSAEDSVHTHRTQYRKVTVEVVNDYEIVFRTDTPNPELIPNISERNTISMEPYSAKDMAFLGGNPDLASRLPAGTGFYEYDDRYQGQFFRMKRVSYEHWENQGQFEEIEMRFVSEASTRLAGLLTAEIHMGQLPRDQQKQAVAEGLKVARAKILARERTLLFGGMQLDKKYANYKAQGTACGYAHCDSVFLDVKVRRALSKAINRASLNNAFFGGEGIEVHNIHMIPTASYWNPAWDQNFQDQYGYDPAAARALLAEAGYSTSNPLEFKIDGTAVGGFPEAGDFAETFVGFWQEIGVKATLDLTDSTTSRAWGRSFDVNLNNRMAGWMTSNIVETQAFRVHNWAGSAPRGGPEFPELEVAILAQRNTVDPVKALDGLRQVGDVIFPLHIGIPIFWIPDDIVYNPDVVASYEWSGVPLGTYSSFQQIKAVLK